jgi:hypothetical protein
MLSLVSGVDLAQLDLRPRFHNEPFWKSITVPAFHHESCWLARLPVQAALARFRHDWPAVAGTTSANAANRRDGDRYGDRYPALRSLR